MAITNYFLSALTRFRIFNSVTNKYVLQAFQSIAIVEVWSYVFWRGGDGYLVGVTALFLAAVDSAGVEAGIALAADLV
jgi:hypothetical protein